jgi:small subunit ribosomal protein S19
MSRSKWKGPFLNYKILSSINNKKKIWCRSSVIPSFLIGSFVFIHKGNSFKKIFVSREKVGFKFGEFSPTRLFIKHKEKSKNALKKKR